MPTGVEETSAVGGIAGTAAGGMAGVATSVKPVAGWFAKLLGWGRNIFADSALLKQIGVSALLYGGGSVLVKVDKMLHVRKARNGQMSGDPKRDSDPSIVKKASERQRRLSKEYDNISQFTSRSFKKDLEVAKNEAERKIDLQKKRVEKKQESRVSKVKTEKYHRQRNKINTERIQTNNKLDSYKSQIASEVGKNTYSPKAKQVSKENKEVVDAVEEKIREQDRASKNRDRALGSILVASMADSNRDISEKISKADAKNSQNLESISTDVKAQADSTKQAIADSEREIYEKTADANESTQEVVAASNSQVIDSNNEGLKALSEQLYNSEKAQEEARIEELKRQNESDAKLDELVDSSNISFNTTSALDKTNQLLATTVESLRKPQNFAETMNEGIGAFAKMLGGFWGTLKGLFAVGIKVLADIVSYAVDGIATAAVNVGVSPISFLKWINNGLGSMFDKVDLKFDWLNNFKDKIGSAFKVVGNLSDTIINTSKEKIYEKTDKWADDIRNWGARKSGEVLESEPGMYGGQIEKSNKPPKPDLSTDFLGDQLRGKSVDEETDVSGQAQEEAQEQIEEIKVGSQRYKEVKLDQSAYQARLREPSSLQVGQAIMDSDIKEKIHNNAVADSLVGDVTDSVATLLGAKQKEDKPQTIIAPVQHTHTVERVVQDTGMIVNNQGEG